MRLVDSHCHIQSDVFDEDRGAVLSRALAELVWIVVVGDTLETSRAAAAMTRERVYAAAGIHPHHADEAGPETFNEISRLIQENDRVVAVGEIGLDFHYEHSSRDAQRHVLIAQLELAAEIASPVIVHNRDAHSETAGILGDYKDRLAGCVMHCFSGDAAYAGRCLEWGCYISFAGNCTFPKADELREAARAVPLDRLLVESDSPYLAPQPVRGKRCEPVHVVHTARLLAELKGVPLEELAEHTARNAARLFGVPS